MDLDSPRVRAAMRVLGLTNEDLSQDLPKRPGQIGSRIPATPRVSPSSAAHQRRVEVFDRKRQELLAELEATVEVLGSEDAERILSPDPLATAREAGRGAVNRAVSVDHNYRLLQASRDRTRAEVQSFLERTVSKHQRVADMDAKKEEADKRLAEARKERHEEEKKQNEEKLKNKQAKEARTVEAITKVRQKQREVTRELTKKLQETSDKVQEHVKSKTDTWDKARMERSSRLEGVAERRQQAVLAAQEDAIRRYLDREQRSMLYLEVLSEVKKLQKVEPEKWSEFCDAHGGGKKDPMRHNLETLQAFLQEQRERTKGKLVAEEPRFGGTGKLEAVQALLDKQQAEKEAAFRQTAENLVRAEMVVKEKKEETTQKVKERLDSRFEKKEQNMEKVRKERYERRKGIMEKLSTKEAAAPKEKYIREENRRRMEQRELMEEVVASNQQRLERANDFAREQLLARIQQNVARVDQMAEQKQQLLHQRTLLNKEALIEKSAALESLRTMKAVQRQEAEAPPAQESK